jgi:hypothetical protein
MREGASAKYTRFEEDILRTMDFVQYTFRQALAQKYAKAIDKFDMKHKSRPPLGVLMENFDKGLKDLEEQWVRYLKAEIGTEKPRRSRERPPQKQAPKSPTPTPPPPPPPEPETEEGAEVEEEGDSPPPEQPAPEERTSRGRGRGKQYPTVDDLLAQYQNRIDPS